LFVVISFIDSVKLRTLLKTVNVLGMFSSPRWLDVYPIWRPARHRVLVEQENADASGEVFHVRLVEVRGCCRDQLWWSRSISTPSKPPIDETPTTTAWLASEFGQ